MSFENDLCLRELGGKVFEVAAPFVFKGREIDIEVPEGFETDLASVPRFLQSVLPSYGKYTKAAVLHDFLWQLDIAAQQNEIELDVENQVMRWRGYTLPVSYLIGSKDLDGIFRRAMRLSETNFFVRWVMWAAVRSAAILSGRVGAMDSKAWSQLGAVWAASAVSLAAIGAAATQFLTRVF